jgi:hypothetical protein
MPKVAVLELPEKDGVLSYVAMQGNKQAVGTTVGKALGALTEQIPMTASTIVIVQRLQPDTFFGKRDQERLAELMKHWHLRQVEGKLLSTTEQEELKALVEEELEASERRAAALTQTLESNR